jgi:dihydroflavonol-4-reductase
MIILVYYQKLPGYPPGGRNFIYVKDAAKGIVNALDKGKIGENYIIGNENLSYKEIFSKIASVIGVKPPRWSLPGWGTLVYGRYSSFMAYITGRKPIVSYAMARISCDDHYYCCEKAVRELDLPQTPVEEGIHESFEWLKSNGYIK